MQQRHTSDDSSPVYRAPPSLLCASSSRLCSAQAQTSHSSKTPPFRLRLLLVVLILVRNVDGWGNDIFKKSSEDVFVPQIVNEFGVVLLQLLYEVCLVEDLLETHIWLIEDRVNGGYVGVSPKPPKHGGLAMLYMLGPPDIQAAARYMG